MARCDQGYICDICGEEVEEITESELYLRFVTGEISHDQLLQSPERHIRCSTTIAQFIIAADFPPVEVTGDFDKRTLDKEWVVQQESLLTRGWRRLHELKGSGLPFSEYLLPELREHSKDSIVAKNHSTRFLQIVNETRPLVMECTVDDIRKRRESGDKFHLVDVREESEFAAAHIVGAIHLGKGVIERDIEGVIPATDADIVLYCGGGYRSALAAQNLQRMGYTNVKSMDGGFRGWKEAGLDIES